MLDTKSNFVVYQRCKNNWCVEVFTSGASLIARADCIKSRRHAYKLVQAFYGDTEAICEIYFDELSKKWHVEYTAQDKYHMYSVPYSAKKSAKLNINKFDNARFDANVMEAIKIIK